MKTGFLILFFLAVAVLAYGQTGNITNTLGSEQLIPG